MLCLSIFQRKGVKKIARSYYGSKISPNQTKTPEGYLILHNVPIARTGEQEYLGSELEIAEEPNKKFRVYREEDDVFSPETIASFEGKPVTSDHPMNDVDPTNWSTYSRGTTTNVRRGTGQESDLLLADLIIQEAGLILAIEQGKREVSCGYDYTCEPLGNGKYAQRNIRGNHVAIVDKGRAGKRVSIKDSLPDEEENKNNGGKFKLKQSKITKRVLAAIGFQTFAKDAEPHELAEALDAMNEGFDPDVKPVKDEEITPPTNEHAEAMKQILEAIQGISGRLEALERAEAAEGPKDALDELEAELAPNSIDNEDSMTVPVEQMATDEAGVVTAESERPVNPLSAADSKQAILAALNAVKPFVANIKDPVERKKASDSLAKTFREQMQSKVTVGLKSPYESMAKPKQAKDSKPETVDEAEYGKNIAKKFNPHYKNK